LPFNGSFVTSNPTITRITARRIWDSRGRPTLEADVYLADGSMGRGVAPAGASRGSREAIEKRDGGHHLRGLDVQTAIAGLYKEIAPALIGMDARDQATIDRHMIALDGTSNKARLGANAIVAVSLAVAQAAAASAGLPFWRSLSQGGPASLPLPEIQIFGGGAHAGRRIDIQDLMVVAVGSSTYDETFTMTSEVYQAAGAIMAERGLLAGVADEGGYWPQFQNNVEALETLVLSIEKAGYVPGEDVAISLDIAASEFGKNGLYKLALEDRTLNSDGMIEMLLRWCERFPIVSIEDALAEDDEVGMIRFTKAIGDKIQIIGDDFLVTQAALIHRAATKKSVNAALIKFNQIGTLTETKEAIDAAKAAGFGTIVSARSGETEDVAIAHLAVGWNAGQLKVGSFTRSERMAKWNEVIRIAEQDSSLALARPKFGR
jgi:enolase